MEKPQDNDKPFMAHRSPVASPPLFVSAEDREQWSGTDLCCHGPVPWRGETLDSLRDALSLTEAQRRLWGPNTVPGVGESVQMWQPRGDFGAV